MILHYCQRVPAPRLVTDENGSRVEVVFGVRNRPAPAQTSGGTNRSSAYSLTRIMPAACAVAAFSLVACAASRGQLREDPDVVALGQDVVNALV